jgi:hypothetical protein
MVDFQEEEIVQTIDNNCLFIFESYLDVIWHDGRDCRVSSLNKEITGVYFSFNLIPAQRRFVLIEKKIRNHDK